MLTASRYSIASFVRRMPLRFARRFVRRQDGAVAVEFALVAIPFLALLFAILETALVFVADQTLEAAVTDASRLIMTGQAQTAGFDQNAFKTEVCNRLSSGLINCAGVYVDVQSYSSFSTINQAPPLTDGHLDPTKTSFTPGADCSIEVVRLYYQWPIYASLLVANLANLNGSYRLLVATSVFRNEPFGNTSCP